MRWITRMCLAALAAGLVTTPAFAAGFVGIGAMSSTVLQEGQSSFSGLGLRTQITSDRLIAGFSIMPTIEYWRNSSSVQPYGINTTRKDATLGADLRYDFRAGTWKPYVGAGYALHFLTDMVDAPPLGIYNQRETVTKGGLAALGGVSFDFAGKVENFVELKYHHVPGFRQLKINWGLNFKL